MSRGLALGFKEPRHLAAMKTPTRLSALKDMRYDAYLARHHLSHCLRWAEERDHELLVRQLAHALDRLERESLEDSPEIHADRHFCRGIIQGLAWAAAGFIKGSRMSPAIAHAHARLEEHRLLILDECAAESRAHKNGGVR